MRFSVCEARAADRDRGGRSRFSIRETDSLLLGGVFVLAMMMSNMGDDCPCSRVPNQKGLYHIV